MPARPASKRSERRASARAERRAAGRRNVAAAPPAPRVLPYLETALFWSATAVLFVMLARGVLLKITWYLAVDQFGYLTFAHDLLHGHVFHHWPPLDAFADRLPPLPPRVDILAQTYVAEGSWAYCRYSPGFPILMAAWIRVFGSNGGHYLAPTVFFALLAVILAFGCRVFHSRWRALVGVALVTLFPTFIHLWAITPTRDLSAHLAGFIAIYFLVPAHGRPLARGRLAAAGVALGYAVTTRPDAVLYAVPVSALFALRFFREGARWRAVLPVVGAGALGIFVGLVPLLAYNWMTMGNPVRATQGMEVERFFEKDQPPVFSLPPPTPPAETKNETNSETKIGYPPPGWHGGSFTAVQGGGLRIAHFSSTFPGNFRLLRTAYGDLLLVVALVGAVVAFVQRRTLFVVAVPYAVVAFLFFSCWARPDGRYLSGVYCMIPLLIVEGTFGLLDVARTLARRRQVSLARGFAVASASALVGGMFGFTTPDFAALPFVVWVLVPATVLSLLVVATTPSLRVARVTAPLVAIALVWVAVTRGQASAKVRAGFQKPEMERARVTFARVVEPGAMVITTEDIGRPAENIEYYSGVARAVYFTDLERWGVSVDEAAARFARGGFKPYLLIPTSQANRIEMLASLVSGFDVERVASIPAREAMDYFVAAPFHRGIPLELYRLKPRA